LCIDRAIRTLRRYVAVFVLVEPGLTEDTVSKIPQKAAQERGRGTRKRKNQLDSIARIDGVVETPAVLRYVVVIVVVG